MTGFETRRANWMAATGLKRSKKQYCNIFRWLSPIAVPDGFDHTGVYWSKALQTHIIITEPYYPVEETFEKFAKQAGQNKFDYAFGTSDTGLWYPGRCEALLLSKLGTKKYLEAYAAELPKYTAAVDFE